MKLENPLTTIIEAQKNCILYFTASWCSGCKTLEPRLEELYKKYSEKIKIVKINVEDDPVLSAKYLVNSLPTLLFLKNNKVLNQITGAVDKSKIEKVIQEIYV